MPAQLARESRILGKFGKPLLSLSIWKISLLKSEKYHHHHPRKVEFSVESWLVGGLVPFFLSSKVCSIPLGLKSLELDLEGVSAVERPLPDALLRFCLICIFTRSGRHWGRGWHAVGCSVLEYF